MPMIRALPRWLLLASMIASGALLSACGRTQAWPVPGGDGQQPLSEVCFNGLDDDGDGLTDCDDPDCAGDPACATPGRERCTDGVDNDGDGLIDCADPDCMRDPACGGFEDCQNGVDDDGDGLIDCADPDCRSHPSCGGNEDCRNRRDDDGDGLIDCADPDCLGDPACRGRERCSNGRDDDGDGLVDCADPDCFDDPVCRPDRERCTNQRDDDGDGLVDCADPDCYGHPACSGSENCTNRRDDDGDGLVDCDDPDCFGHLACGNENCQNGVDDDGDGFVDCYDPDCFGHPACPQDEICDNGIDDDKDSAVDCEDSDCQGHPSCPPADENCTNGRDDDGDFLVDCDDPDCFKHPDCKMPGAEICNNGVDDDEDGKTDCDDEDCAYLPICQPGQEDCANLKDDDGDGAVDCDDPDCANFPGCQSLLCKPPVDFGVIAAKGGKATRTLTTQGHQDVYLSSCAVPGGGEEVARFTLAGAADVKLDYEQLAGDHIFALYRAGVGEPCNANPRGCYDPESQQTGSFSIKALGAGEYYLFAEAFAAGLEGSVLVTLSTGSDVVVENCQNGVDDDGDGAIDCADIDCALTPVCAPQLCKVDVNLGTLVINGAPRAAVVDTSNGGNDVEEACAGGGGGDRVIRFVMPEAGGVAVEVEQQGWHAFGMHANMGPGTVCTADAGSCFDSYNKPQFHIAYGSVEKGEYFYVVDGMKPGDEGIVQLSFYAFANRGPELCANQQDDDGDGLVDCMDPDCTGVIGCPGPVCSPEHKTGPLAVYGPPVQVSVDTSINNNNQTVPCALGGGKDVVVEIELTEVSGLEINCSQTGDHVLGLFAAGQPRDPCDKNPENCADLKTGPFGCNFIFPNIQPGRYYLVVEAFKAGTEGTVDLYLAAVPDHAQEICNNGIDDDGDGKVDCQDSNCASMPICQGTSCVPDQKLGLLVVGGPKQNVAVTTVGAGDSASATCALGGGEDSVIGLSLLQPGTIEVDYAQFGNHVLSLNQNKGTGFACDAAPVACQETSSQSMGTITFPQLPPGEYYLVIEAAAAGSEGSVVMQIAAK